MCKPCRICLISLFACAGLSAETPVWQPSAGHTQIPIWPGAVPDPQPAKGPESGKTITDKLVAGRPWRAVTNVSQPTMTVYSPQGKNTGAAVVIFPGGGYQILAIDLEGTEVCDWLNSRGITAVLLKYRVPIKRVGPYGESLQALQDAQRTLGLVRFNAAKWHIDPHKIGVIGFSAGGHMVTATSTHYDERSYPAVDAADKESCRPDFAIALYPGHLWVEDPEDDKAEVALNPNVPVNSNTPPTFILQATDDPVDNVNNSLVYYIALKKAKVPVEMHLYPQGGHAFGLAAHEVSDHEMACSGGDVAEDDWDDWGVERFTFNRSGRSLWRPTNFRVPYDMKIFPCASITGARRGSACPGQN